MHVYSHTKTSQDRRWDMEEGDIRYDTIESLTWTRKLSIQLYLAHVARKRN